MESEEKKKKKNQETKGKKLFVLVGLGTFHSMTIGSDFSCSTFVFFSSFFSFLFDHSLVAKRLPVRILRPKGV